MGPCHSGPGGGAVVRCRLNLKIDLEWSIWTPNFPPISEPHLLNYSMIFVCGQVASWGPGARLSVPRCVAVL